MHLQFLGSGDAFGSGGRLNTCFLLDRADRSLLIDCGASAMISIRRFGIDPNRIAGIVLSHLHGDHFGGLPFFILDAQLVSRRTTPLMIVGPPGLAKRLEAIMEACFPGSAQAPRKFRTKTIELDLKTRTTVEPLAVAITPTPVRHPSGAPSMALRLECEDRTIAYTGDTEWVDGLIEAGHNADVLIAEAYTFERRIPYHLDFASLRDNLSRLAAKRVVLTHMSPDMLSRDDRTLAGCERAFDGMLLDL